MYTLFEYKIEQNEISRTRGRQNEINVILSYTRLYGKGKRKLRPGILLEHGFKHKGNHYATLPWSGMKIAQKRAKRIKTKT